MKRKKKKAKWRMVLMIVIFLILILGGSITIIKTLKNNDNNNKVPTTKNIPTKTDETTNEKKTNANLEKAPKNNQDFLNLEDGEYLTEKGYTLKIQDKVAYIDNHIIVNKTYSVPSNYEPKNTENPVTGERCNNCLEKEVMESFRLMQSDAASLGLNIYIASGYRSYIYQDKLYNNYVSISGKELADTYSARPGHSEHQTGFCFDLNSVDDSFANTNEGKWINENADLYGFIIRYPKAKESITGYQYESWHLRYVGKELANKLHQDGVWLTLEEYYGISSSYE